LISSRRRGAVWRWRCRRRSPPTRGWQADKFKEDIEASEVLSDDKKRELYNAYGHAGVDPNASFGGGGSNPFGFQGCSGFSGSDGSFHFSSSNGGQEIEA
jgi:molecular chaperone DnaJ